MAAVSARTAGGDFDQAGISLVLVDGTAAGLSKRGYSCFEGGRAAEVTFSNVQLSADALGDLFSGVGTIAKNSRDQAETRRANKDFYNLFYSPGFGYGNGGR